MQLTLTVRFEAARFLKQQKVYNYGKFHKTERKQ